MDENVPYMNTVTKLPGMLDAIQNAGIPETFNKDFLQDLGYTSSYDRSLIKLLRYLGMLDTSNRPQDSYKQFVDHTKARGILAERLMSAYDDLYMSDKNAHERTASSLKGWFKSKTGAGDAVAKKMATTFKSLADYADFNAIPWKSKKTEDEEPPPPPPPGADQPPPPIPPGGGATEFGLVYRFEIHLPDTQNVDTFRAIFKAMKEELMP